MALILTSFTATLVALAKIALVIGVAAWMVHRKIFNEAHTRALTAVVVNLALPCLVFSNVIKCFDVSDFPHWWKFPLIGAALCLIPLLLARLVFNRAGSARNTLIALSGLQNAGYLVLPVGEMLFPEQFEQFSIYIFLMLLAYMPILWSVGTFLISHREGMKLELRKIMPPPFCVNVLAMILVFTGLDRFIPEIILEPVELVGTACVPLATVVLGLTMGALHVRRLPRPAFLAGVVGIKLLVVPTAMFFLLKYTGFSSGSLENAFWIIEAASPPATALVLQMIHFGGDEKLVCGTLVTAYLAALFTMPLFLSLVQVLL
ncbi:MAG: AEC family transporter [Gemmatimonadota bacterium]|nr:AEC family transporter [Gemmatimonadota bacterium]